MTHQVDDRQMTLEEWVEEQRSLLQLFKGWYLANQRVNPEQFPERLSPGEWDEQAQMFDPGQINADFEE